MENIEEKLKNFLDGEGRLCSYPTKRKMKIYALIYIAQKLEPGKRYTEKELNEAICAFTDFNDPATMRRELYDFRFIDRENNGSIYRMEESQPTATQLGLED